MSKEERKPQPIPTSSYKKRELLYTGTLEERLTVLTGYSKSRDDIPEPTYKCPCSDVGWVPVEGDDLPPNTWKPCARCEPERYARWAEGKAWAPTGGRKVVPKQETLAEKNRRDLL